MRRNVFRVVAVRGINVIWASSRLFSTEERANSYIDQLASDDEKLYGHATEKLKLIRWQSCCMEEATRPTWLTVYLVTNVFYERDSSYITYGVVTYELD